MVIILIGFYKLLGRKTTSFMEQAENPSLQTNLTLKMSLYTYPICKDMAVGA